MRSVMRRAPRALAVLPVALSLLAPAASAAAVAPAAPGPDGGGAGEIRITELGGAEAGFFPVEVNVRGQVSGLTFPTVSVWDRGRLTQVSPPPPDPLFRPHATTLNERGDVAGTLVRTSFPNPPVPADARPYLWSGGRHVDLGFADGFVALDVNERRQVLMAAYPFGTAPDRVWDGGTVVTAPVPDDVRASFVALNSSGVAAGTVDRLAEGRRAAVWRVGRGITELGTLGGDHSTAGWITEAGAVYGQSNTADGALHAFVWRNGRLRDLGTLGGFTTVIRDVSTAGDVVGTSGTADGESHGFLWRGGELIDLGPELDFLPSGVNVWGQVVGCSFDPETQQSRLWLRQGDRGVDLTGWPASPRRRVTSWTSTTAARSSPPSPIPRRGRRAG